MPYTVNHFLQQVSLGLWNGCSFHRNAGHVVQGGPISNHLNPGAKVRKGFKEADLGSVVFQEYHKDFPHKKYTLGYAGRPGGPDFYVSTVGTFRSIVSRQLGNLLIRHYWLLSHVLFTMFILDNTRNHGPGGQQDYAMKSEADPCFAKVIDGFDAVDRMHSLSVQPGDYHRLSHYVAIKSATLIP
jgi:cyclophilin family peptidyl-prolyl cis-trans isomerase